MKITKTEDLEDFANKLLSANIQIPANLTFLVDFWPKDIHKDYKNFEHVEYITSQGFKFMLENVGALNIKKII